ncbi:DUF456 domain-containing protein [Ichthyenterobacterium sp. W332]|uniref:DUF456 domain-containing protein n=1 Tax=Microcosmobacter mediterraneus TaxID=3075607 RepID=A0ABU2YM33_9FLAO|nr:DUF456 domain-containing protein [Ichthyenterobacterium sp. W332]MDT0558956.1 DUF456 domain-containing protein [Ichthyenterobacterium sp. W332]
MDIFLVIVSLIFMILGIVGSFMPILPGPLTSWIGLLILKFTDAIPISNTFITLTFIFALGIWFLDYIIPALGTKRFGGSKAGMVGTTIGLLVGLFSPVPGGIIIGPFFGALAGELTNDNDVGKATKAAFGSFLGFIVSTFLKFIVALIYFGFFLSKVSTNWSNFI